jgi:hypothetical protein
VCGCDWHAAFAICRLDRFQVCADQVAKKLLDSDQYEAFKNGPMGRFQLAKAAENALQSDAAAYFEMVTSSAMSYSGVSVLTPCSRQDITLLGVVGASAQAFGESVGESRNLQEAAHENRSARYEALQGPRE